MLFDLFQNDVGEDHQLRELGFAVGGADMTDDFLAYEFSVALVVDDLDTPAIFVFVIFFSHEHGRKYIVFRGVCQPYRL